MPIDRLYRLLMRGADVQVSLFAPMRCCSLIHQPLPAPSTSQRQQRKQKLRMTFRMLFARVDDQSPAANHLLV